MHIFKSDMTSSENVMHADTYDPEMFIQTIYDQS